MLRQAIDRVPGDIVIRGRFQQTVMWGAFIVILALGLAESIHAQPTTSGKTAAVVFFGLFIALCALLWWRRNRRRPRLQVTGQEIRYFGAGGNLSFMLTRDQRQPDQGQLGQGQLGQGQPGQGQGQGEAGPPVLVLVPPRRTANRQLTIPGSGDYLNVRAFSARRLRHACESRGWRFADDPALIAREASRHAELARQVRQQGRGLPR
jgi:hypothetical protein